MSPQSKEAMRKLERAIEQGAKSGSNYFNLGMAYYSYQDYELAVKNYGIAVGYSPNEPTYWMHYAKALKKVGQLEEAQKVMNYAIELGSEEEMATTASNIYEQLEKVQWKQEYEHGLKEGKQHWLRQYYVSMVAQTERFVFR